MEDTEIEVENRVQLHEKCGSKEGKQLSIWELNLFSVFVYSVVFIYSDQYVFQLFYHVQLILYSKVN